MSYQNVLTERLDRVALITLNRPEKLNAMSYELACELDEELTRIENDSAVDVVPNPLAFQILQRLDMGRAHPDIGVLVSPARDDVQVRAPGALEEDGPRLDIQGDVHRLLLHGLGDPQLLQPEGHHGITQDLIGRRPVRVLQTLVVQKVHLVGGYNGYDMKRMVTGRCDSQLAVQHQNSPAKLSLDYNAINGRGLVPITEPQESCQ